MNKIDFVDLSSEALKDSQLQSALHHIADGFVANRIKAVDSVDDFQELRNQAKQARDRAIKDMDIYLLHFEQQVQKAGGHVHWAQTPEQLAQIVVDIAKQHNAKTVLKGKSMVAEEADLNHVLEANDIVPFETDLGEYIIQLANEPPSHIVVPALHKTKQQIKTLFEDAHDLGERDLETVPGIVNEARSVMRERFLSADMSITGANMLIAETGQTVLVTNEGNGDLSSSLPNLHIITSSIDKIIATRDDAAKVLRVLARSATGQPITAYTSFYQGPKRSHEADGPEHFHIVLLDNKRSEILGSEFEEMLNCIRCGACMNHCPVYTSVGGHAYDSVYPGPMGSVLTPLMQTHDSSKFDLPNASTFCGRCAEVCPVKIPLPDLLRKLRVKAFNNKLPALSSRWFVKSYMWLIQHPKLYAFVTGVAINLLSLFAGNKGKFSALPFASGWTTNRDMPAPQGKSFQQQWAKRRDSVTQRKKI